MTTRNMEANQAAGRWGAAAVAGIAVLFAGTPAQAAFTPITVCPYVISTPGAYQLMNDLVCPAGDGIKITVTTAQGGGVSLKLNGKKITAGSPASVAAIYVMPSSGRTDHVVISGPGLITNNGANVFQVGIEMDDADFSQVSQVTVVGSASRGIHGFQCTFLTVASNIVGQTKGPDPGDGIGLSLELSGSSTVSGNDSSGNVVGIDLDGEYTAPNANPNTVSNNIANGNSQDGIHLEDGRPEGARVSGNVTNGNGRYGIHLGDAAYPAQFFSNTSAAANGVYDLVDDNAGCTAVPPTATGVWSNNVFLTKDPTQTCIH